MRKLMWFSIGFAMACGLCAYILPTQWIIPVAVIAGLGVMLGIPVRMVRRGSLSCFGLALGLVWFLQFQTSYLQPAIAADGAEVSTTVTVTDYSYETTYGVAADGSIELHGKTIQVRVYVNEKTVLEPGDTVTGTFRMRYTAPGGVEEATYHSGKGIFLLAYQRGNVEIIKAVKQELRHYPAILAQRIKNRLQELFPEDVFPFTQALLLGDSSELSYETDTALKISGIRHIIAVSGLHVTILYSLLSAVTFRKRYLTALLSLPSLFVFAAVAGFTPSVTRACIMVLLMILAQIFNKQYDPPTALAFASLVMLVVNPFVITAVGFQLTVGCVAGIQLFNEPISSWLKSILGESKGKGLRNRGKRWFISSVSVTLGAMSLTTPLCAYFFGTVSLVGILTNLLTLWVVNLIFNGLIVTCLLSLITMNGALAMASVLAWPIRFVLAVANILSRFPLAAVYTESAYIVVWLVFVYVLLVVLVFSEKRRPFFLTGCAVLGLCAALVLSWMEPLTDECRVTMLDVGQGQSIVLQSEGKTFLVDCGGDSDTGTADRVAETLLSQGVFRLDGIILTHCDRDHAGALENLLTRIPADRVFYPATTEVPPKIDGNGNAVQEDMLLTFGSGKITIFGPEFLEDENENSLCVLFETENCDILVTGDRGNLGEMLLLQQSKFPEVDLLVAGHHGSKYATSEILLEAVKPEIVFISAGLDNPYGHPAPETLARLDRFGCRVYRTDQSGTLIFRR